MLCVEFSHVKDVDISEIVHALKSEAILTGELRNLSTLFVISRFLSTKVSHERRLTPGFATKKKCPFPLEGNVPSIEVTNTKIV